jgi:hypothetical protein
VVAKQVGPTNNLTGVPDAELMLVNKPILAEAKPMPQNSQSKTEPEVPQPNATSLNVQSGNSQSKATSLNAILERVSQPNATPGDTQPKATSLNVIIGNSQPNAIPQQKSSIMTESEFMKKYEITEIQIKQVKLLLSNAFAA